MSILNPTRSKESLWSNSSQCFLDLEQYEGSAQVHSSAWIFQSMKRQESPWLQPGEYVKVGGRCFTNTYLIVTNGKVNTPFFVPSVPMPCGSEMFIKSAISSFLTKPSRSFLFNVNLVEFLRSGGIGKGGIVGIALSIQRIQLGSIGSGNRSFE